MSNIAVFAYLRALRDDRKWSQERIARAIGVSAQQVYRYESGREGASALLRDKYVAAVGGSPDHVHMLQLSDTATAEDGLLLARLWLEYQAQRKHLDAGIE
jgi:transcriptional regulator with XRE-family HTH domain